jgi:hypothetical protein
MGSNHLSLALITNTWPPEINGVAMSSSYLARGWTKRRRLERPYQAKIKHLGIAARQTALSLSWDAVCDRFDVQLRQAVEGEVSCRAE